MSTPQPAKTIDGRWIRYRCASYLRGKGISFGSGSDPIYPQQAMDGGKYSINMDVVKAPAVAVLDIDTSIFAKDSLDHVFIGARDGVPLQDLCTKLKLGGHLVIHALGADIELIRTEVAKQGLWQEKDTYNNEGQILGIWKLQARSKKGILPPKPKATKRACICRYGAIGDMIMISPLIKQLHTDGYEVTLNITPYCAEVLKYNPYVSNIVLQERDVVPNSDLGDYWACWMNDYDKYINLSESIEGKLLKVEGRPDFYTSKAWRNETCGTVNYFDQTMRLGGYPDVKGVKGELYFSKNEEKSASLIRERFKDKFFIMWALKGSSHHKVYPLLEPLMNDWLRDKPDVMVALVGAQGDKPLVFEHPQIVDLVNKINLRDVFCLTKYVDLVAGPESAITNAAGCFDTPKVVMLTHSSHENLCKYWTNDYCITPVNTPCYPCHQLHYSLESCPITQIINPATQLPIYSGPLCSTQGFRPEIMKPHLDKVYKLWQDAQKAA